MLYIWNNSIFSALVCVLGLSYSVCSYVHVYSYQFFLSLAQLEISPKTEITFKDNVATEAGGGLYVEFPPIRYTNSYKLVDTFM